MTLKFYNIQNLSDLGRFSAVALVLLLVLGMFIPEYVVTNVSGQLKTANGEQLKYIDQPISGMFLESIRNANGVLCLGTSESTPIESGNYYDFLNADSSITTDFSVLAGAGRTCGNYMALFEENREVVEGLKVLYQINPVYWRTDLAQPNKTYTKRYSSLLKLSDLEADYLSINNTLNAFSTVQKWQLFAAEVLRKLKRNYFQNLQHWLEPNSFFKGLKYTNQNIPKTNELFAKMQEQTLKIDTATGCLNQFSHYEWFKPIDTLATYRTQELLDFITLCKALKIELTCVITPVNHTFIQFYQPKALNAYQHQVAEIQTILKNQNVPFVTTDSISLDSKAFIDHQHYSSHGAYRIYKALKPMYP